VKQSEFNFGDERKARQGQKKKDENLLHEYNERRFYSFLDRMASVLNHKEEKQDGLDKGNEP